MLNKAPFNLAVETGNIEIIKLLLAHKKIDVNVHNISFLYFYFIFNHMISLYFKSKNSIEFRIKKFNMILYHFLHKIPMNI